MSLATRIESDLLNAVKNQIALERDVLRGLKSAIKNYQIEKSATDSSDEEIEQIIAKEAKKRRESIDAYIGAGKEDLAQSEREELVILERYLPEQLSEQDLEKIVSSTIGRLGDQASVPTAMETLSKELKGKADLSVVARLVNKQLTNR